MAEITAEHRQAAKIEAQRVLDRVLGRGTDSESRALQGAPYKSPTGLKRGENLRDRGPIHDYEEIVQTFKEAGTIAATARRLGIHRETVRVAINKAGLSSPPGRRKKEK